MSRPKIIVLIETPIETSMKVLESHCTVCMIAGNVKV